MRSKCVRAQAILWVAVAILACCRSVADAQEKKPEKPKNPKVHFKVFLANNPSDPPLVPRDVATIQYRSKFEDVPDFKFDLKVNPSKDKEGFYEVEVAKDWLVEQLVIRVTK